MQQVSELTISYKPKVKARDRYYIDCSEKTYKLLMKEAFDNDTLEYREYFKVILLNRANKVLGITTISEGGTSSTIVDVKLILQAALLAHSSAVILAHNHPGGNLKPSGYDDTITHKIQQALALLDIVVHDHVIVTTDSYYSYADEGRL